MLDPILTAHAASTVFLAGLIWFVQVVHYPLFARVDAAAFPDYARAHASLTTRLVAPAMLVELATAILLAARPPAGSPSWAPGAGLALLAVIWLSTAFLQVPRHRELAAGFDGSAARRLVSTNWIRTAAWSARAALALLLLGAA